MYLGLAVFRHTGNWRNLKAKQEEGAKQFRCYQGLYLECDLVGFIQTAWWPMAMHTGKPIDSQGTHRDSSPELFLQYVASLRVLSSLMTLPADAASTVDKSWQISLLPSKYHQVVPHELNDLSDLDLLGTWPILLIGTYRTWFGTIIMRGSQVDLMLWWPGKFSHNTS